MTTAPKRAALIELTCWLIIAAFFYGGSFEFSDEASTTFSWGPAFWPRLFAGMVCFAALMQFYDATRTSCSTASASEPDDEREANDWFRTISVFVLPLIYVFSLPRIGFYVATPFFLIAELIVLGERNPRRIASVVVGVFMMICLVFTTLFYVGLPIGNWPGFYEINSLFVQLLRIG